MLSVASCSPTPREQARRARSLTRLEIDPMRSAGVCKWPLGEGAGVSVIPAMDEVLGMQGSDAGLSRTAAKNMNQTILMSNRCVKEILEPISSSLAR